MERDFRENIRVLWKRKWIILLAFVCAVAVAGGLTARAVPTYEAAATLFVGQRQVPVAALQQGVAATQLSRQLVQSYAQIVRSRSIAESAIRRFDLDVGALNITNGVRVQAIEDTLVIRIAYRSPDPARASRVVNAVAQTFVDDSRRFDSSDEGGEPAVLVSIVDQAFTPQRPISPNVRQNIALAGILGLAGGIGLAFLFDRLDVTVKGKDEIDRTLRVPVLATVPKIQTRREELYLEGDNQSVFAETFRKLRTAIQLYGTESEARTILVSSPRAREGKSTTAINLAAVYAYSGSRTILVEADMRRPKLHEHFSATDLNGFTMALLGRISLDQAALPTSIANLSCIPAGAIPPNPAELLSSRQMRRLLDDLRLRYDTVVIDAPPLLPVADATTIAPRVDGVVVVARVKQTKREELKESVELIRNVGGNLLGVVLNAVDMDLSGSDYSYYDDEVRAQRRRGLFARS